MRLSAMVLAGGHGTRFWPVSRRSRPKQLLALGGDESLLRQTVERIQPPLEADRIWVVTTRALEDAVREELSDFAADQVLAEPEGRNTAPAIAWALARLPADTWSQPVVVLHSDHHVIDRDAFRRAVLVAAEAATEGDLVITLGVRPTRAETGYGYLELEQRLDPDSDDDLRAVAVRRFVEKPDRETAESYLAGGRHLWNAGIFVFRPEVLFEHLRRLQPEIHSMAEAVRASSACSRERESALYATVPRVSIDTGVMEKIDDIQTVPLDCGWDDLGSWQALATVLEPDAAGNRSDGETFLHDARDNLIYSKNGAAVALIGVEGLAVVSTGDAVLVVPVERSQEVREIVARLTAEERDDLL